MRAREIREARLPSLSTVAPMRKSRLWLNEALSFPPSSAPFLFHTTRTCRFHSKSHHKPRTYPMHLFRGVRREFLHRWLHRQYRNTLRSHCHSLLHYLSLVRRMHGTRRGCRTRRGAMSMAVWLLATLSFRDVFFVRRPAGRYTRSSIDTYKPYWWHVPTRLFFDSYVSVLYSEFRSSVYSFCPRPPVSQVCEA